MSIKHIAKEGLISTALAAAGISVAYLYATVLDPVVDAVLHLLG